MSKGYVSREEWREAAGKKIADYWFDSRREYALFWETREEAEAASAIFEKRAILISSTEGGEHCCTGFTVEELGTEKFVVFCHAPFIASGRRAV
jgi:hypothetical protein